MLECLLQVTSFHTVYKTMENIYQCSGNKNRTFLDLQILMRGHYSLFSYRHSQHLYLLVNVTFRLCSRVTEKTLFQQEP